MRLRPAQTSLSGTLSPFRLNVDDQLEAKRDFAVESLRVNGQAVPPKGRSKKFFLQLEADELRLEYTVRGSATPSTLVIAQPRVLVHEVTESEILFLVTEDVRRVTVDGNGASLGDKRLHVPITGTSQWLGRRHLIELVTPTGKRTFEFWVQRPSSEKPLQLTRGGLGVSTIVQPGNRRSYSLELDWTPRYRFSEALLGVGELGLTFGKKTTGESFPVLGARVLGIVTPFRPVFVGLGGGTQTWFGNGGTRLQVSARAGIWLRQIDRPAKPFALESLYLGASYLFSSGDTLQFTLQTGIAF